MKKLLKRFVRDKKHKILFASSAMNENKQKCKKFLNIINACRGIDASPNENFQAIINDTYDLNRILDQNDPF